EQRGASGDWRDCLAGRIDHQTGPMLFEIRERQPGPVVSGHAEIDQANVATQGYHANRGDGNRPAAKRLIARVVNEGMKSRDWSSRRSIAMNNRRLDATKLEQRHLTGERRPGGLERTCGRRRVCSFSLRVPR